MDNISENFAERKGRHTRIAFMRIRNHLAAMVHLDNYCFVSRIRRGKLGTESSQAAWSFLHCNLEKTIQVLQTFRLAGMVSAIVVAVDTNRSAALLALCWWGIEHRRVFYGINPRLWIVHLQSIEGLPRADEALGHWVSPHVMRPKNKVIQFHHLPRLASTMILDPFNTNPLTTQVLSSFECVP